jgi:cysteine desulfurase
MNPIYLDYNATTPLDPAVVEAMEPFLREHFGNPSSTHAYGRLTCAAVERSRQQVAALLGATPGEIVFTSGGSEASNQALKGVVLPALAKSAAQDLHAITSAVEHWWPGPARSESSPYIIV